MLDAGDALLRAGPFGDDPFGTTVAGLGDVDGDGLADTAILHEVPGPDGRPGPAVRVVLGSRDPASGAGFTIDGAPDAFPDDDVGGAREAQEVGMSVAGAGDVNGDGLDDVVLGAASLGNSLRRRSGSAFVVFGKRDGAPVRLDALGDGGFRVDGPRGGSGLGFLVAGLGDVNGDGRSDVALTASRAAYVVFGKADGALVDLREPGEAAYAITGPPGDDPADANTHAIAAAGDANGDGRGDVLVSTSGYSRRPEGLWLVFGKADTAPIDLRQLGAGGYEIAGSGANGIDPHGAGPAGDVNGDGLDDVVLAEGRTAWVVHGRREPGRVDVRRDGAGVLRIRGVSDESEGAFAAAAAGDVNGDGLADLAFGDPGRSGSCRTDAGALTVVFGRREGGRLDVRRLGMKGFLLVGDESGAGLGSAFAAAGDTNGDGRPDLVLDVGRERELRVVTAADTGRAVPRREPCVILRSLTRSLRQARAERRWRVRLTVKEPGQFLLSPDVGKCDRRECWLDPNPDFTGQVLRFDRPGTRTVSIRIGRRTLRELRRPHVTDLTICANDGGPCVELPTRRRR